MWSIESKMLALYPWRQEKCRAFATHLDRAAPQTGAARSRWVAKALSGLFCFWRQGYKASILDSIDNILALLLLLPDNQPLHLKLAFCLTTDRTRLLRGHLPDLPRIAVTQLTEEALVGSFATSCVLMVCCDVVPAVLHLLLCCACQA